MAKSAVLDFPEEIIEIKLPNGESQLYDALITRADSADNILSMSPPESVTIKVFLRKKEQWEKTNFRYGRFTYNDDLYTITDSRIYGLFEQRLRLTAQAIKDEQNWRQ